MHSFRATVTFREDAVGQVASIARALGSTPGVLCAARVSSHAVSFERQFPHDAVPVAVARIACEEALLRGTRLGGLAAIALDYDIAIEDLGYSSLDGLPGAREVASS